MDDLMKILGINVDVDINDPVAVQKFAEERNMPKEAIYDMYISTISMSIDIMPENYHKIFKRGDVFYVKGDYNNAIKDYDECIRLKPNHSKALHHRGDAFFQLGFFEKSIESYSLAIEIDNQSDSIYYRRALAYKEIGKQDLAINDLTSAINIDPIHKSIFYFTRGEIYESVGKLDLAGKDFKIGNELQYKSMHDTISQLNIQDKMQMLLNLFNEMDDKDKNSLLTNIIMNLGR
jgi:tetratricopeptide (TPR) repeat protein